MPPHMKLFLKDGSIFEGESFGANKHISGEVVFNTGMVGYPEAFTDPSYAGQILVCTYPLIGNYGVPDKRHLESKKIQIAGLVVSEYSESYSHRTAKQSLADWLEKSGVPAISGVDTRALTRKLREHGVMLGQMVKAGKAKKFTDPNETNLAASVSIKKKEVFPPAQAGGKGSPTVVLIDCGAKENIVRSLVARGARVIRVPWDYDFTKDPPAGGYDGVLISNGPGDPRMCKATIEHIRSAMADGKPVLGICLGNQLLALAAGASTYKLKYGHRSQNQPCSEVGTKRCYITSQNHGYAVDGKSLPHGWEEWFVNANDGSNEGIRHKTKPFRSVQFHPEANPGPTDAAWIFDDFLGSLRNV